MNVIAITGRLARDPELRTTQQGAPVTSFCVAVDRPGTKDKVDFLDCVAWKKTAEFVSKYFRKGDGIEVMGNLTARIYDDKDGNKRKAVEINANRVNFPKGKKKEEGNDQYGGTDYQQPAGSNSTELDDEDGDLPF